MPMNSASTKSSSLSPAPIPWSGVRRGRVVLSFRVQCRAYIVVICCRYIFFAAGFTEGAAVRVAPEKIVVKAFLTFARTGGGFPRGSARMN